MWRWHRHHRAAQNAKFERTLEAHSNHNAMIYRHKSSVTGYSQLFPVFVRCTGCFCRVTLRLPAMVLGPKSNDDLARDMLAARSKKSKDTWPLADAVRAVAEARSEGLSLLWNEQK